MSPEVSRPGAMGLRDSGKESGVILVLSAPSGAGKTTIAHRLLSVDPGLCFSVSHTTRSLRPGEQDGKDYHFVSRHEFEAMRDDGEFLEWAEVHGHFYGTHRREVERAWAQAKDLVLDIDVQGGLQVKRSSSRAVLVFILPPSLDEMLRRIKGRGQESEFNLAARLETARKEVAFAEAYDYNIVNEELDRAVEEVLFILRASRNRPDGCSVVRRRLIKDLDLWLEEHGCSK